MNYYRLDVYDRQDNDFCFLASAPEEIPLLISYIASGKPAISKYPNDVSVRISSGRGGIVLSDIIANKNHSLIVHQTVKEVIETFCEKFCEYLPLDIINHKGRLASNEYFYVNPLGTHDCLNLKESVIKWTDDGKVIKVRKFVLDKNKLDDVPPLFRVPQNEYQYFINQQLVEALRETKPDISNLNVELIEVK
ncbi:MAG: hypothetical protein OEX19_02830 [Gammaproteobacteria bacterium]|nr:hypothetical protein [Gammaproteobacteria bacterium]